MKRKYFTKKKNGIKRNVILNIAWGLLVGILSIGTATNMVSAAPNQQSSSTTTNNQDQQNNNNQQNQDKHENELTYTEPFQNTTTSLTGLGVTANSYFTKPDYWIVKQATLNLNYQVSQLASNQISNITVEINGVKFYSFTPKKSNTLQSESINIPLDLLQGSNNIRIIGQIQMSENNALQIDQTPANWLTIYNSTNVNYHYMLQQAQDKISSFYDYFTGADTINNQQCAVTVPDQPTNSELTAATYALSGFSRTITSEDNSIPICPNSSDRANNSLYRVVIGLYKDLPSEFQQAIDANQLNNAAVIKTMINGNKHYLIITAKTNDLLIKASRYVANKQLMSESQSSEVTVNKDTQTFTAAIQNNGDYQLTTQDLTVVGSGHQEATFFVNMPVNLTNAAGSLIKLNMRYAKNLDFSRSLMTVYVNNQPIGSQKLNASDANNDSVTIKVPANTALNGQFVVRVAFDLVQSGTNNSAQTDAQTPWATVESSSVAYIRSKPVLSQLFSNYPSLFLNNDAYDNLVIVRPSKMNSDYFETLSNIFNLFGSYTLSNTGKITYQTGIPDEDTCKNHNMIVIGTPQSTPFIKKLNKHLYMKYNSNYQYFLSNEKMSIAPSYGRNIGTAQLLRSPYNGDLAILAVTAPASEDVLLASTQINFQKNIQQYNGDTIVVDHNNNHYGYRFKKKKSVAQDENFGQQVQAHISTIAYFALALIVVIVIVFMLIMIFRKHNPRKGKDNL